MVSQKIKSKKKRKKTYYNIGGGNSATTPKKEKLKKEDTENTSRTKAQETAKNICLTGAALSDVLSRFCHMMMMNNGRFSKVLVMSRSSK